MAQDTLPSWAEPTIRSWRSRQGQDRPFGHTAAVCNCAGRHPDHGSFSFTQNFLDTEVCGRKVSL